MPELPEVETVRRGLAQWLPGKKITEVLVLHPRATNSRSIAPLTQLSGARIETIQRRGKFLWFTLNRPYVVLAHLGMSGQFLIEQRSSQPSSHTRVRFTVNDRRRELRFIDQRTFGWIALDSLTDGAPTSINHIARDIFDPQFRRDDIIENLRMRSTSIKAALLNQEIMSGIGNIYADESLWQAEIHPERVASSLSSKDISRLMDCVKTVMSQALDVGGTSFDDLYINVNGESGYFDVELSAYGQEGEPCPRCGTEIKRIAFANRSSHFCPKCQRKPRVKKHLATRRKTSSHTRKTPTVNGKNDGKRAKSAERARHPR
mgnify:FL=1